jgi:UPF0755 protein
MAVSTHVWLKRIMTLLLVIIILAGIKGIDLYHKAFAANIFPPKNADPYLYILTGSDYSDVIETIKKNNLAHNLKSLEWTAEEKNYKNHVNPGKYRIKNRMSNNEFINMLRSGKQEPVQLTFNNIRTLEQFANRIAEQLELDDIVLLTLLKSDTVQKKYGMNRYTINCMFIPNTYEFYWNTTAKDFIERMHREYESFWNNRRTRKAEVLKLTREEVITLASIVDQETDKNDEKARIAGVYLNRLNHGMRLQADPTLIYAMGKFDIQRVLRVHYQINSPFNTYRIDGLPPGPICFPEIVSIEAVLNAENHDYLYMCAKPDFSGYHVFSKTLKEHNRNAELYRRELNKRKIYR